MKTIDPITSEVTEYTNKNDIEHADIPYLSESFLCADDAPLRSSPLLNNFGYKGDAIAEDDVTAGTYVPPPDTDDHTNLF